MWNRTFAGRKSCDRIRLDRCQTLSELSDARICFVCLPTNNDVLDIVTRKSGLAETLQPGSIVVDATSGDPAISIKIAKILSANDISFVDCPVSGGPAGATARLTSMMGGSAKPVRRPGDCFSDLLEERQGCRCWPCWVRARYEIVNNCLNATHLLVAAEGLLALKAFGVEPSVALEVINNSSSRSLQTQNVFRKGTDTFFR